MELEFHQLDLRYEALRVRRPPAERRLVASLAEKGQQVPIVVVVLSGVSGRYAVIDGYKRVRALRLLRRDTVLATVWSLSESEALILDRSLRSSEAPTALEQGWLVRALHEGHGLSGDELALRLGRSPSWVSRHLGLARELPPSVQELVRAGRIPPQAAMKYLLPMCRAHRVDAEVLAEAAGKEQLSSRDLGELYRAWQTAGALVRERLLSEPGLFLRTRRELARQDSPAPLSTSEKLRRDLELIGVLARRAARTLRENGRAAAGELPALVTQALTDLRHLERVLKEAEESHADPEPAHDDPGDVPARREPTSHRADAEAVQEGGPEGDRLAIGGGPPRSQVRQGQRAPGVDPGPLRLLPGQPGPGP